MGLALEVIAAQATNIGAGPTNLPAIAGSTLVVRNARLDSRVWLLNFWAHLQVTGFVQLRSPRLHDNVRGLRAGIRLNESVPRLAEGVKQSLVPQDTLIFEGSSADAAGNIESMLALLYYEDLAGGDARLIAFDELMTRGVNVVTVDDTFVAGVAGGFSGEKAINAGSDLLKANTDYALVGYESTVFVPSIQWRGIDSANLRVGGPGDPIISEKTRSWFSDLARAFGMPMIPVFNSANRGGWLVDIVNSQVAAAPRITSVLVELAPKR